jgi:hypothetical protein
MVEAARIVGLVYVAYFILAVAGMTLRNMPLQLVGTGSADGAWLVLRRDGDRPLHRAPGLP